MAQSQQERERKIAWAAVYLILYAGCFLMWAAFVVLALGMMPLIFPGSWRAVFVCVNVAVILSVPFVPIAFGHGPLPQRIAQFVVLAMGLLVLAPIAFNLVRAAQAFAVKRNDNVIANFEWPQRVAIYSNYRSGVCNPICAELLYNRLVKEIIVVDTSTPDLKRGYPKAIEPKAYRIESRETCPEPDYSDENGLDSYEIRERTTAGQCLVSEPARDLKTQVSIIYSRHTYPTAKGFNTFARLQIVDARKGAGGVAPVVAQKTEVSYYIASVPLYTRLLVRAGGSLPPIFGSPDYEPRSHSITMLREISPSLPSAVTISHDKRSNPALGSRALIAPPHSSDVSAAALMALEQYKPGTPMTELQISAISAGVTQVRANRTEESAVDGARLLTATFKALMREMKKTTARELDYSTGNALFGALFSLTTAVDSFEWDSVAPEKTSLDATRDGFDSALFERLTELSQDDGRALSNFESRLLEFAAKSYPSSGRLDAASREAIWRLAARLDFAFDLENFIEKELGKLNSPIALMLARLSDRRAASDWNRVSDIIRLLTHVPSDLMADQAEEVIRVAEVHGDAVSDYYAAGLFRKIADFGEIARPTLDRFIGHDDPDRAAGAAAGLCKLGLPANGFEYQSAIKLIGASRYGNDLGYFDDTSQSYVYTAVKFLIRSDRASQFLRESADAQFSQTISADTTDAVVKALNEWRAVDAADCENWRW